jgi:putative tricarboxylic transport membrane protein
MGGIELGLNALLTTPAILAAVGGVIWGIFGGALPGISPSIAMALLLPFTYGMDPTTAIVLLASTYVGAEYGGSIPAILIRTPGTNAASATVIDGYEMQRQGRGGEALGISLVCGTIGGLFGLVCLILVTEPLANVALLFTPPALFALGVLGLSVIASLSDESLIKGLAAAVVGLMIASVGTDPVSGVQRFTFDLPELIEGVRVILIMMGVFAVAELFRQASEPPWPKTGAQSRIILPKLRTLWKLRKAQAIGWVFGLFEGLTPGGGGTIAAFLAYNETRRWSKEPQLFGKGSEEGVAAPETANNVVTASALIPTLSFGIPGSNSTAILLGGLLVHGLQPGPLLFQKSPEFVWGLYAGLLVANLAMFVIGIVILTPAIWLVNRPKPYLMAAIFALILSGVYSVDNSLFDLGVVLAAGVLGYVMRVLGFPFLPLILGVVLGYMIESNYRRSLLVSSGDHMIFLTDPLSLALLLAAAGFMLVSLLRKRLPAQEQAPQGSA